VATRTFVDRDRASAICRALLASREEASSIARAASAADVSVTTGFGVDRAKALTSLEDDYQVVHLATHGILNDEHPLLSGIVTSLVDKSGARQDGFLRVQDVYDTRVGAEVVVLSAVRDRTRAAAARRRDHRPRARLPPRRRRTPSSRAAGGSRTRRRSS
jgi:CHAT domain-containing protein